MDRHATKQRSEAVAPGRGELLPGLGRAKALIFLAAGMSFLMSVSLYFSGDHERGIFVGLWVPSILSAGTLLFGSEHDDR